MLSTMNHPINNPMNQTTLTVAGIFLKSAWQAVLLRSALATLLLVPLGFLHATPKEASAAENTAPGPVLEVIHRATETCETATLEHGAQLFSDRPLYKMSEPPAEFKGQPFLRASIDGVRVRCIEAGTITVLSPPSSHLERYGFERISHDPFQLWGTEPHTRVHLYRKTLAVGETIRLGKFSIWLGFNNLQPVWIPAVFRKHFLPSA